MPATTPRWVSLDTGQRLLLRCLAGRTPAPHRRVIRARIVLAAAGCANAVIAARLGVHVDTVRKWRRGVCEHGIDGLTDRPAADGRAGSAPRWWPRSRR